MRRTTALWTGLALALGITAAASAGDGHGRHGRGFFGDPARMEEHHAERFERVAAFLDLSEQQVDQWQTLHAGRVEAMQARHEELEALHERIRELAEAADPDAAAVGELVIEAHRKMAAARAEGEALHAEALALLTPEQRERFEAMQHLRGGPRGDGPWGHGRHLRHHGAPRPE
ncbi:MAG: periplasmic heavy metal sensor [Acidobacteriota bacterium]|nr:periplasmic heavy metal sensor [Acidobacteriota bacterium]MDH3522545.1 periplasmic heavy metal sensor [Acidobacteriota bacterium]